MQLNQNEDSKEELPETYEPCFMCEKPTTEDTPTLEFGTITYCADCFNNL